MGSMLQSPASFIFVLVFPFSFFPKLVDGDTQPWPLVGVVLLLFANRAAIRISTIDMGVLSLAILAVMTFFMRAGFSEASARFAYKVISFTLFWFCSRTVSSALVSLGMKMVIVIWFVVGLFQTMAVSLGQSAWITGRFVEGRGGVPSLAPEPSLYGMLSVVAILYLLFSERHTRPVFILMALANVFMSGSALAVIASIFVVSMLRFRTKLVFFTVLVPFVGYLVSTIGFQFLNRVIDLFGENADFQSLIMDYSINLRVGHIVYTLGPALLTSLFFLNDLVFEEAYNDWALSTFTFFPTGSDFILTGIGDIVYNGGIFGLGLLAVFFVSAYRQETRRPWIKLTVIIFLMLVQVGFASLFLAMFGLQRKGE